MHDVEHIKLIAFDLRVLLLIMIIISISIMIIGVIVVRCLPR